MQQLKEDIKKGIYKRVYLLCGTEHYMIKHYENKLRKNIMPESSESMNLSVYQGKDITANTIIDSAETLPFFNEYRLIVVKDSGFFTTGRKEESDRLSDYITDIPDTTVIVFIERDVDKRNGLYKKTAKYGRVTEFKSPSEKELTTWIINYCKTRNKNISPSAATTLLRTVANSMDNISTELDKLIAYKTDEGDITSKDIETVCSKLLESRIFDLVGAMGHKDTSTALDIFSNMLQLKESPIMILTMIARQFRMILLCKHLHSKGLNIDQISDKLSLKGFIVRECVNQGKYFKLERLKNLFSECLAADVKIKTGQMSDRLAVEMLILSAGQDF